MNCRNPSPPPGYVREAPIELVEKNGTRVINGIEYLFYDLLMESGVFDGNWKEEDDEFKINTDSENEAENEAQVIVPPVIIKEEPKSDPELDDTTLSEDLRKNVKIEIVSPKREGKVSSKDREKTSSKDREKTSSKDREKTSSKDREKTSSKDKDKISKDREKKKKKKEKYDGNDSSGDSSYSPRPLRKIIPSAPRKRHTSISSSEEISEYEDRKIKIENIKVEKTIKKEYVSTNYNGNDCNMLGTYYCPLCKAVMNSYGTFQTHVNGKRHQKQLKLQNTADVVSRSIPPVKVENRYPPPPPGVHRVKTNYISKIQHIVEKLKSPCIALDKVIEIQGLLETTYYCELCDAPCAASTIVNHLQGHRHQLRCLKYYEPDVYESFTYKHKRDIDDKVISILKIKEEKYGRGVIQVEREYEGNGPQDFKSRSSSSSRYDAPGPSHKDPDDAFPAHYASTTIPDTSKSDFYCKLCDSHMNSEQMWEAHIRGKRHLANVKKAPGEAPSRTRSILVPHARAKIYAELDHIDEPAVGLSDMRETQNPNAPGAMYNCFLCGACMTNVDVLDHVFSLKHKVKYLEKIGHQEMLLVKQMNIPETKMISIIDEICTAYESEHGRGHMEVHVVRNALILS